MIYKWWLQWGRSNMIYKWWLQWGRSNNEDDTNYNEVEMMIYKWWLQWGRSNNEDDLQMMTPMR